MKLSRIHCLPLLSLICSSFCLAQEEEVVFRYQPVIEANCRISSKGAPLKDVASILIQERSNSHKGGINDEDYFVTPARRSEIPQMLARGDTNGMEEIILKGRDPVLWVTVFRQKDGKLAMRLGMRARDQPDYDPHHSDQEASGEVEKTANTTTAAPANRLPSEVNVGTEPTSSKEFKLWVEEDPAKYSGNYAGEVGGDSGGSLEINLNKGKPGAYPPFFVNGTFQVRAAGSEATILTFKNAACDLGYGPEVNTMAFKIFFVQLDGKKGAVVGDIFLPKE